jgi:hypothetical protein
LFFSCSLFYHMFLQRRTIDVFEYFICLSINHIRYGKSDFYISSLVTSFC